MTKEQVLERLATLKKEALERVELYDFLADEFAEKMANSVLATVVAEKETIISQKDAELAEKNQYISNVLKNGSTEILNSLKPTEDSVKVKIADVVDSVEKAEEVVEETIN